MSETTHEVHDRGLATRSQSSLLRSTQALVERIQGELDRPSEDPGEYEWVGRNFVDTPRDDVLFSQNKHIRWVDLYGDIRWRPASCECMALSGDGRLLATVSSVWLVIWDTKTGREYRRHRIRKGHLYASGVTISPGSTLVGWSRDGDLEVVDLHSGKHVWSREPRLCLQYEMSSSLVIDADETVIAGAVDGRFGLARLATDGDWHWVASPEHTDAKGQEEPDRGVPHVAARVGLAGGLWAFDAWLDRSFQRVDGDWTLPKLPESWTSDNVLGVDPTARVYLARDEEGAMSVRDVASGAAVAAPLDGVPDEGEFSLSWDGRYVARLERGERLELWDTTDRRCVPELEESVVAMEVARNGSRVVEALATGAVRVRCARSGAVQHVCHSEVFAHRVNLHIAALAICPFGRWVAVGTDRGYVHVLDTERGQLLGSCCASPHAVTALVAHPEGWGFLAGSLHGQVAAWRVHPGGGVSETPVYLIDPQGRSPVEAARCSAEPLQSCEGHVRSISIAGGGTTGGVRPLIHVTHIADSWGVNTYCDRGLHRVVLSERAFPFIHRGPDRFLHPDDRGAPETTIEDVAVAPRPAWGGNHFLCVYVCGNGFILGMRVSHEVDHAEQEFVIEGEVGRHTIEFTSGGRMFAVASEDCIEIWDSETRERVDRIHVQGGLVAMKLAGDEIWTQMKTGALHRYRLDPAWTAPVPTEPPPEEAIELIIGTRFRL